MPELNDPYDYNLNDIRSEIENKWDQQQEEDLRRRELNGMKGLGSGSWTSRVNRSNANKRDEYMKALAAANEQRRADTQQSLAQRQQAFAESSNYSNLARLQKERAEDMEERKRQAEMQEKHFGLQHGLAQKQMEIGQEQFGLQHGLAQQQAAEAKEGRLAAENLAKEKFAYQKTRDAQADKEAKIVRNIQLKQQALKRQLQLREIDANEFRQKTEMNLRMIEAQTKNQRLRAEAQQARANASDPDAILQQLQGMMNQAQGTGRDMNAAGVAQQQVGANIFASMNANQQALFQRELGAYFDTRRMQQRAQEVGEAKAKEEELREAAKKAQRAGALGNIMSNVLGIAGSALI